MTDAPDVAEILSAAEGIWYRKTDAVIWADARPAIERAAVRAAVRFAASRVRAMQRCRELHGEMWERIVEAELATLAKMEE